MNIIRISKEFTFEMAHALYNHNSHCAGIHGHSYHLTVTIAGPPKESRNHPKEGMVMDFSELKSIVEREVIHYFDHALILHEDHPLCREKGKDKLKLLATKFQPTCENLLIEMVKRISPWIRSPAQLYALKLYETPSSYAEWFLSDN